MYPKICLKTPPRSGGRPSVFEEGLQYSPAVFGGPRNSSCQTHSKGFGSLICSACGMFPSSLLQTLQILQTLQAVMPSYIVCPGHGVVNSPLVDGIKVSASMQRAEVWPVVTILEPIFRVLSKGEDANICCAHQVDPDGLEAVVCTRCQHGDARCEHTSLILLRSPLTNVALETFLIIPAILDVTVLVDIIIFVDILPKQVEAM